MREIKFRCWDKCNKEMLEVQELDYENSYNGQPMVRTTMYNDYFDTEDMILMQYTGLKDKNGKEVYEGDIIQHLHEYSDITDRYKVIWDEEELRYAFQNVLNKNNFIALEDMYDDYYGDYSLEVIGNIYDNPKLLEEG